MYRIMKEMAADLNWLCNAEKVSMEIGEKLNGVMRVRIEMVIIVALGYMEGISSHPTIAQIEIRYRCSAIQ
jgi:hypothetical protein